MRILCLDIGDRRTGAAICDEMEIAVEPLETIAAATPPEREEKILGLIAQLAPDSVVLGLPLNMDGSAGPRAQAVLALADTLRGRSGIPVDTWDERLSSHEADHLLRESGLHGKKRKKNADAAAAALILRGYLANKKGGS